VTSLEPTGSRRGSQRVAGRVVVVGAGHNGLVCAIRLAAAGLEVVVVDGADAPGGAVRSRGGTLPGFVHDTCAGFFPLAAASPALRDLPLERHGLEWVDPPLAMAHPFDDGTAIALHRALDATAASLDATAPGAGRAWRDLVERLRPHRELLFGAALSPFPPVAPVARLALRLRAHALSLVRLSLGSAAGAGRALFGDERAAAWLAGSAAHSDLAPDAAPGGALALGLALLGHLVGWPYPRGGAQRLTDALVAHLEELGGELRCGAVVERIELDRGRAAGVRLATGERVASGAVVASVSAGVLGRLVPDGALPRSLERRLRRWRYGVGTFKLDLALAGPVPWTAAEAREAAVVHVGGELESLARAAREAARGELPADPVLVVGQHSLHDPSRAPEGRHTLYVYTHVPQRPPAGDEAIADRLEERIERFAPGFRSLVLARSVRGPAALEADNPSLVGGDLGGGSYALDQQLALRPAPRLVRGRTPIAGLYVAGASVHPGAGVHGVSGAAAARALIEDASPLRFWRS
jgi:phytoene dehydrogenase-like protein